MSEHIDCVKSEDGSVVYQCKVCNIQSKRKRKLFVNHVLPVHIGGTKKKDKRRKNKIKVKIKIHLQ